MSDKHVTYNGDFYSDMCKYEDHDYKNDNDMELERIPMEICAQEHYRGPINDIDGLFDGEPLEDYKILEKGNQFKLKNRPIFKNVEKKWGWKEELLLLESVEDCGLFDWEKIADRMHQKNFSRKKFTPQDVQKHFFHYYLNGTMGQVWNYRLVEKPVLYFDHTEDEPVDEGASSKYLPLVTATDLKSIKFLPHREEFEAYPPDISERMVTRLDFSSFYLSNLTNLKIGEEVKELQLAIVDSYRRKVSERVALRKFMKDYKLIEQFFYNKQLAVSGFRQTCQLEKDFKEMQKFISLFDSSTEFLDFYFDCVKEELIKLEIARLVHSIKEKRKGSSCLMRDQNVKTLLEKRAPGCYSTMTEILYYAARGGKNENSNLPGRNVQGSVNWVSAHRILHEGLQQQKLQLTWPCDKMRFD